MIDEIIKAAKSRDLEELERLGCFSFHICLSRERVTFFRRDLFREITEDPDILCRVSKIDGDLVAKAEIGGVSITVFNIDRYTQEAK